jgi:hypothetical protein
MNILKDSITHSDYDMAENDNLESNEFHKLDAK